MFLLISAVLLLSLPSFFGRLLRSPQLASVLLVFCFLYLAFLLLHPVLWLLAAPGPVVLVGCATIGHRLACPSTPSPLQSRTTFHASGNDWTANSSPRHQMCCLPEGIIVYTALFGSLLRLQETLRFLVSLLPEVVRFILAFPFFGMNLIGFEHLLCQHHRFWHTSAPPC